MKIERPKWILRSYLKKNPEKLFLFGDNMLRRGYGGQAKEMRGEDNAVGIPTKWAPGTSPKDYFGDKDFDLIKNVIDAAIMDIINRKPEVIVIPRMGIGTGLAKMDEKAPDIFRYLQEQLQRLEHYEGLQWL